MIIKQIPDREYFPIDAFSNSAAKLILKSPMHYKANTFTGSTSTRVGTASHARLLNERWDDEIKIWNGTKTLTSKAAQEFIATNPGFTVITQEESDKAKELVEAQPEDVLSFFRHTQNEIAIIGEIDNVPVKCKVDAHSEKMKSFYDFKTTESLEKFQRSFYDYGYHTQAAWYLKMAELAGLDVQQFLFYVVESSPPYCSKFVACSEQVLEDGKEDIEKAFEIYKQCYLTDDFSEGYTDDVLFIERPYWRRKKKID